MKLRSVIAAIAALSILIIPGVQNAQAAPSRYITVNAEGTVKVTPNAVKIMGQVTVVEGTNGAALAKANSTSAAVRKAVLANGVSAKDLATTSLKVYPEYNYTQEKGSVQIGYRASQSFTIVVKNAANAGAVVDAIAAAGGDFLQLQGVSPFVLDNSKATEAARSAAVKNAKAKAISYAKLLGVKLGKVNYLTEGGATYNPPIYGVAKASADEATVIDLGTQDVSVSITVQWALI
ncbi:MAG: DUF541 domain-containing protein [Candidatus Nanopelagicaceae bacterium]|nr:DUF541 domain-containing protein [Candidatus Nanopelagicaceae bacterium]